MLSGPVAAAKLLQNYIKLEAKPRKLFEVLQDMIEVDNELDKLAAADLAEKWMNRFETRVGHMLRIAEDEGSFLPFAFNSASKEFIQGACFVEGTDTAKITAEKQARAQQESYLQFYQELCPNDFEKLCGKVIGLLKVDEPKVTRSSADQGVDFFGQLPFGTLLNPKEVQAGAEKQLTVWIVGQAKHYLKTTVSTKDIRELVGSVVLARSKTFAGAVDPLEGLDLRVCDPVVFFFITTGRFTRDSRELLKRSGVVAMDGLQLSVFLADNLVAQEADELTVDAIADWLKT